VSRAFRARAGRRRLRVVGSVLRLVAGELIDKKLKYRLDNSKHLVELCIVRSYGQYCALARTLDVVGERWTLLIIRELFAHDARYSDLRDALPGIATNLLAERLRHLREHGVIETYDAPAPVRAAVYRLTPRGRELGPALTALVGWGMPLLTSQGDDEFRAHWMALGLPTLFAGVDVSDLAPLEIVIQAGDAPATLAVTVEGVTMSVNQGSSSNAVTIEGSPEQVLAFMTGAAGANVKVSGLHDAIERLKILTTRARDGRSSNDQERREQTAHRAGREW
jgi:DNA-binding HxlR family transcriptional regulator